MKRKLCVSLLLSAFCLSPCVMADTYEVLMKNRGAKGAMVFEPDYIEIKPGDTIKYIRTHKSHNAASIPELWPASEPQFKGKIDEEIEVTFKNEGFYGVKCIPHYAQGHVMMVRVGKTDFPEDYRKFRAPGLADKRLKDIFSQIDESLSNQG